MGVDGGGVGEGGGGEGSGGEGSGGEGGGGESGGGGGGGGEGAQPGVNTPYAPHVSGHSTATWSLEVSPVGSMNSIPPAAASR